ncbi:hypothetical protein KSF_011480 [Reticulibacter mediterranei]|uniref:Carboxymuconolactone decarboxylase-like domain-containing protein n=1 Tax=Reticulibacter mediterranei TaxID=2778369 RepID=A0A8J3IEM8_9CHLR|nr:hypothetical protein KSF_011480 [Reticulibacter mediterranei]
MRNKRIEQMMRDEQVSDIRRIFAYRPELFGEPFSICLQDVMRGSSEWTVGERELIATFTSSKNKCVF